MRASSLPLAVGGAAVILTVGFANAPEPLAPPVVADPTPTPSASPSATAAATPSATPSATPRTAEPTEPAEPSEPAEPPAPVTETFDGPAVSNARGTYQARITVTDGVVTEVEALQAGTSAAQSVAVNSMAIPEFRSRVLAEQTWDVGPVSGASFTSPAFLESLEGAFGAAGLT